MGRPDLSHAAPPELEPFVGGAGTINMSLLRSWSWVAASQYPNWGRLPTRIFFFSVLLSALLASADGVPCGWHHRFWNVLRVKRNSLSW